METVIPVRFTDDNIIICNRATVTNCLETISCEINDDVYFRSNAKDPSPNTLYGYFHNKKWHRATVKFSDENKKVIHLLDDNGIYNFHKGMVIREIKNQKLINIDAGQIKIFVHAIHKFKPKANFQHIFKEVLLNTPVTAVFSLVEEKSEMVHEIYAGDFLYQVNGKLLSFRELLIREKLSYPNLITGRFNKILFQKRAEVLSPNNILTITDENPEHDAAGIELIDLIGERFEVHNQLLGEGSVSSYFLFFTE